MVNILETLNASRLPSPRRARGEALPKRLGQHACVSTAAASRLPGPRLARGVALPKRLGQHVRQVQRLHCGRQVHNSGRRASAAAQDVLYEAPPQALVVGRLLEEVGPELRVPGHGLADLGLLLRARQPEAAAALAARHAHLREVAAAAVRGQPQLRQPPRQRGGGPLRAAQRQPEGHAPPVLPPGRREELRALGLQRHRLDPAARDPEEGGGQRQLVAAHVVHQALGPRALHEAQQLLVAAEGVVVLQGDLCRLALRGQPLQLREGVLDVVRDVLVVADHRRDAPILCKRLERLQLRGVVCARLLKVDMGSAAVADSTEELGRVARAPRDDGEQRRVILPT
mmetsp:Transcript_16605/g.34657  ORF Transcript_16605/g.34657 Transcript_16605/m.34657 type:complete len:342 (-) Transcript_16605:260-1285(-)